MKRIIGALSLFLLVLIGTIAFSPKTHAYLTENCVAIQYRNNIPSLGGTGGEEGSQVWSTDKICKKEDGTLYKGKLPKNSIQIKDYPKITISKDKKSVTVTTCKVNPTIGTSCKGKETSKPISYKKGGDFNQFARSIHGVFSSAKTQNYFELLDVDVSNAKPTNSEGDEYELGDLTHGGVDDVKEDSEMMEDCANAGGAKSLGWVICPIMSIAGEASESLYNQFVEPSLRVEPQLFTGGDSNALQGWQTFQGIANTLFVILFLIVIVSQLTGVGIDNYGIKKILPKLIVTAILINLSYFLCLLFIDISNILGNSFQALFEGLGSGLNPTMSVEQSNIEDGHPVLWTAGSLAGLGVLGTLVTMAGTIWEGPQIVLSLAIGAIGILIAIFFLFILLAARQAAIVVLVVISPVAVVCYALPNTKRLFDKWVSIFKGLLVVYPVAGLLVGGGNYVAALMLTTGSGFFISLVSMIAGIIPIFFIPTLVRSSLSALGNIGTRISNFGDRMGRRTQNYARNTEGFKGLQERGARWSNERRAGLDINPDDNSLRARIARASRGGRRGMARARASYKDDVKKMQEVDRLTSEQGWNAAVAGLEEQQRTQQASDQYALMNREYGNESLDQLMGRWNDARVNGAVNEQGVNEDMDALTRVIFKQYGTRGANAIGNSVAMMGTGDARYDSTIRTLRQTMTDDSSFNSTVMNKVADLGDMVSNNGMIDGQRASLRDFSARLGSGDSPASSNSDVSALTGSTIQRGIDNGAFSTDRMREILESTDPAVQSALQGDPGKRDRFQGAIYNTENGSAVGPPQYSREEAAQRFRNQQANEAQQARDARQVQMDNIEQSLNEINQNLRNNNP